MADTTSTRTLSRRPFRAAVKTLVFLGVVAGALGVGIGTGVCPSSGSVWFQFAITGFRLGAIYAMVALGYTMVYGVLQLINFAHSEVFMIGGFAGLYTFSSLFGITNHNHPNGIGGPYLVFVLAVGMLFAAFASGLTAVAIERVAYRPLRRRGVSRLAYLITAIGVSLFLSNLFYLLDGHKHLGLPFIWPRIGGAAAVDFPQVMQKAHVVTILGTNIDSQTVLVVAVAAAMLVALDWFVHRTRAGQGIRAVAEDPETASLLGVNIDRIIVMTFFVGGLMAGVAGMLYGLFFQAAQFNMGFVPGIKAFTAAVLGGIGNIRGAMLGGLLLGMVENLGVACFSAQWQSVIAFVVLVGVLMFRPTGLLGEQVGG
ncbi:MAG: branched-chain amino acid ABC transporter permease [Actinomycetota bacterium]